MHIRTHNDIAPYALERKDANTNDDSKASYTEVASKVDALGSAWEQFKSANDLRLKEIEKKGSADPLLEEKISKLNAELDGTKTQLDKLQTAVSRPDSGNKSEGEKDDAVKAEYKTAFVNFLKKGNEAGLADLQSKALSVGSDPDGGYVVTPAMSSQINKFLYESSPMRQLATVETISTDSLEMLDDVNQATAGWVSETGTRSETDTPKIGKRSIVVHEMYAEPRATQKLLDDANIDMEAWLNGKVSDVFARTEATAFFSGNGVGKPRGILAYTPAADASFAWGNPGYIASGSSGAMTFDGILNTISALKEPYAVGASWLMRRTTEGAVRVLKDSQNRYLWEPSMQVGKPNSLAGYPVYQAADMEAIGASAYAAAFGNWKQAYTIVDRFGIRILRDQYTAKPFVKFYTTKRVGGDVTNFEAYKLLKLANS